MDEAFRPQTDVRRPWRRYLDALNPLRPQLHRYCLGLTGNVWDAEDLVQDALVKVFGLMGKIDADLSNPRAYLIRAATTIWIDRKRREARERAVLALEAAGADEAAEAPDDARAAVDGLFRALHPQERAAVVMKDVFDLSLDESAAMLGTSVGAVKDALSRGRGRLASRRPAAGFDAPPRELVERFMNAMATGDLETLRALCTADLEIELVGGAQMASFEAGKIFFAHARAVFPMPGFGTDPWWRLEDYEGETIVVGFRTLNGVEGVNEVHRLDVEDGKIRRVRCYCFAPDTLKTVAAELGLETIRRPYRSPAPEDFQKG